LAKLPNFLNVEPRPFDIETYEDELADTKDPDDDDEEEDKVRLRVENTIRWRYGKDRDGNISVSLK